MPELKVIDQAGSIMLVDITTKPLYTTQTRTFLFGQDSQTGTPFITQVHRYFRTVGEAIGWLMPKPVRDAITQGLEVKRQGDWFFVPCKAPAKFETVYLAHLRRWLGNLFRMGALYAESGEVTNHRAMPYLAEDGQVERFVIVYQSNCRHFVRGTIEAYDHPPLELSGQWHRAIRRRRLQGNGEPGND